LNKMKALLIQNKDNKAKLEEFKQQLESWIDPTLAVIAGTAVTTAAVDSTSSVENKDPARESIDIPNREKVLKSLDDVLAQDAKSPIKYTWWSRDISKGLDCSWLLIHTWNQSGIKSPWGDSRAIFKSLDPQLVQLDEEKKIKQDGLKDIQKWDVIFWNSINPKYKRSTGNIPEITKDDKTYRIHHIAFVDKINYDDGTIDIVESNGSQWVTKSTIEVNDWLTRKEKNQSELYIAHVDYNSLDTLQPPLAYNS